MPKFFKNCIVGFTQVPREFCFSAVKNDLDTALMKFNRNLPMECSGSCESDFYRLNADILKLAGAIINKKDEKLN